MRRRSSTTDDRQETPRRAARLNKVNYNTEWAAAAVTGDKVKKGVGRSHTTEGGRVVLPKEEY